jgi:predicted phosphate transport protein (TIGR00153 family)
VEKIGQIVTQRDMEVPAALRGILLELVGHTANTCSQAKDIIERLDELLAVGFSGKQSGLVAEMITSLKSSEHQIDHLLKNTNRTRLSIEDQLDPVSVMFWYKLIELIGEISNQAENIGDRIMLFIAR